MLLNHWGVEGSRLSATTARSNNTLCKADLAASCASKDENLATMLLSFNPTDSAVMAFDIRISLT